MIYRAVCELFERVSGIQWVLNKSIARRLISSFIEVFGKQISEKKRQLLR